MKSETRQLRVASELQNRRYRRLGHRQMDRSSSGAVATGCPVSTVEARQRAAGDNGSGPGTVVSLRRAVRPLEHSRVQGWADIRVRRALHPNLSLARPQDRYECATSRAGSASSFEPEDEVCLPMLDRAREPSRRAAGTWQWQVQSQAAPRRQRVRVQHEPTGRGAMARTDMPASPARWSDGPASQAQHHGLSNHAHNMARWPVEQDRSEPGESPRWLVPESK